ncbi:SDR family oxidoreductase [Rhodobacteraceae bacterium R_SAG10]|jgi:dihydroxyacid dehydratase/phosphogluconate dehydratase|nr:SDR family oxidoreductase [Rhodobacteraceae bacterium R_SAG10]
MTGKRHSSNWYGAADKDGFIHRSWMQNQEFPDRVFDGRAIIGICITWSELTPCNSGLRDLAEAVIRGVSEAGGFPVEFPVMSLGETQMKPTAMLFRNLLAMDVEEPPEALAAHQDRQCLGDALAPDDIVDAVLFLASGTNRMMTGQMMVVERGVVVSG